MGTSPIQYINSPVAGTQYKSALWCGCIGATGDNSLSAVGHSYTGSNGGGSLTTVTGFEIWILDASAGDAVIAHFGPGGPFNGITTIPTSNPLTSGQNGHYFHVAIKYTGGGSPGSFSMVISFGSSGFFWPGTPSPSPTHGGPGTTVTLTGSTFSDATDVQFNGTSDGTYVVNSDTSITAHTPAGATSGPITVINPVGSGGGSSTFIPYNIPTISSFSPAAASPGSTVTINGAGFLGVTSVDFNGVAASSFSYINDGQVTAVVPTGATVGRIHLINPAGTATSATNFQPGQIFFGPTATNSPVAVWMSNGGAPAKVAGVWVKSGAGVKRIW